MHFKGFPLPVTSVLLLVLLFCVTTAQGHHRQSPRAGLLSVCNVDLQNVTFTRLLDCVQDKSLAYLDQVTASQTIDLLGDGAVRLVRRKDPSGLSVQDSSLKATVQQDSANNSTWAMSVVGKLNQLLHTHVLQIDVNPRKNVEGAVRGRRRRNQMLLPAMMFGLIAIGMILIPIGFQFLSMFAGKAVLLSKLAFMLASINGLKRFANSGINYGFYQAHDVPPPQHPPYNLHPRPLWERMDNPRSD